MCTAVIGLLCGISRANMSKSVGPATVPSPDRGYISLEEVLGLPQFWLLCRSHGVLRAFVAQSGKSELGRSLSSGAKKDY